MKVSKCSNCGGADLYRSVESTSASGRFGPDLLPQLPMARFRVVVCKTCGLTSFFAQTVDTEALSGPTWERLSDGAAGPLGLTRA